MNGCLHIWEGQRRLVWGDDDPVFIRSRVSLFERAGFRVFSATTTHDTLKLVQQEDPDLVILDLNWSDPDPGDFTGFEIEKEIRQIDPLIPTIAYSAWVGDPEYDEKLESEGRFAGVYSKTGKELDNAESIRQELESPILIKMVIKGECGDLSEMPLKDFKCCPTRVKREISKRVYDDNVSLIQKELARHAWVVLCKNKVVASGLKLINPEAKIGLEKQRRLIEHDYDAPTFYYVRPPIVETLCSWRKTGEDDYYPSIRLEFADDGDHFTVEDDFDTGCDTTHINGRFFHGDDVYDMSPGLFLTRYWFYEKVVGIVLRVAKQGSTSDLCASMNIRVVPEWQQTGFVHHYKDREVLVGRDIMRAFPDVRFILNWGALQTKLDVEGS